VTGVAPFIEVQALVAHEPDLQAALVRGIDPAFEPAVSEIGRALAQGRLDDLKPGAANIVLGRVLAYQLGVAVGDSVTLMIPVGGTSGDVVHSRIQRFTVSGIFEVGLQEQDGLLALAHVDDIVALRGASGITGLRLKFADAFAAPALAPAIAAALGGGFEVSDWTREHASYFRAIRIEKTMMTLIMLLIVAVAAFNIVATLVMVVTDKRTDIAILRTIGARPRTIVGVFMTQGVVIGWLGTALGIAAGIAVALNVETLAPWLERTFGFEIMDADVFYITRIPSDLQAADVVLIGVVAFLLTVLATVYPAIRAARTQPAEALRYE
jgi:lipoprotein-releasing system permease protein